jgi:CRISPR-associated protein Cmr2
MPNYDIFAANHLDKLPTDGDTYMKLLRWHAKGCFSADPAGETEGKKELKSLLAKNQPGLGHHDLMAAFSIDQIADDALDKLPKGAAILRFDFTLAKKYVSRDDAVFFPTENPLRRDHVFKVPLVAPATWKGSLRAAAVELFLLKDAHVAEERLALMDLFGDEKADEERPEPKQPARLDQLRSFIDHYAPSSKLEFEKKGPITKHKRGRLIFFPSWFQKTVLDVINPRNRATRAGTIPITIEAVPSGEKSSFTLLYLPFDLLAEPADMSAQAKRDWKLIGEALLHMLSKYGFGAKKSSGCGKIRPTLQNLRLDCRSVGFVPISKEKAPATDLLNLADPFSEPQQ